MYEYNATVSKVDGGTMITVTIQLGFGVYKKERLKLKGIETPELRGDQRPFGLISREKLTELVLDQEVIIKTFKYKNEKYGRYEADVYIDTKEYGICCVNDWLVENKLAIYREY